jgi:hypothetical protein
MSKVEYSDFYKFIASVGITLIALSLFVPWIFLKEPFDLLLHEEDFSLLTPLAQGIIQSRQEIIRIIINYIPAFTIITLIIGVAILITGGLMWFDKTQKFLDKLNALNVIVLEQQLKISSPDEVKAQQEEEIKAQLEIEPQGRNNAQMTDEILSNQTEIAKLTADAIRIEERIFGLLASCVSETHFILSERRVGPVVFDLVLASKSRFYNDRIVEIKYVNVGFKYNWLRDNALKLLYANQIYHQQTNRNSLPILLIVGANSSVFPGYAKRERFITSIEEEFKKLNSEVNISMITEDDLFNCDCKKINFLMRF